MFQNIDEQTYSSTGSLSPDTYKTIIFPFNQYELKIKLTPDNKFIDILEIKINKDFLSHNQKMASLNDFDVEPYLK